MALNGRNIRAGNSGGKIVERLRKRAGLDGADGADAGDGVDLQIRRIWIEREVHDRTDHFRKFAIIGKVIVALPLQAQHGGFVFGRQAGNTKGERTGENDTGEGNQSTGKSFGRR